MIDLLLETPVVSLTDVRKLGRQRMLGRQMVNVLLKGGFWPHESVESPSFNHSVTKTYHHQGQFYILAFLVPCGCI